MGNPEAKVDQTKVVNPEALEAAILHRSSGPIARPLARLARAAADLIKKNDEVTLFGHVMARAGVAPTAAMAKKLAKSRASAYRELELSLVALRHETER